MEMVRIIFFISGGSNVEECLSELGQEIKIELMPHQKEALQFLGNGRILYGGVGAGKSAVSLAYYMENESPRDVYIITTAKKRDSLEWDGEAAKFGIGRDYDGTLAGRLTVDSWNNIGKYLDIEGGFFIFDEQRLVGTGAWVKHFLKIVKRNRWIMLSATPGDIWLDYAPVFVANGWYKNITDFKRQHVVYASYVKFPKVSRYLGEQRLEHLRNQILVEMPYLKHTERILNFMMVGYDKELVTYVAKNRWNIYEDRPIKDAGELWRLMRRIVNSDPSRIETIRFLMKFHPKLIIFYNFDYELQILRGLARIVDVGEWNGHRKQPIPTTDRWVYLVQYAAGGEGWNCTETDSMILYSLTYSYKNYIQSQGRIDRLDTPFTELYYYILGSLYTTDKAVMDALEGKKSFNERSFLRKNQEFSAFDYLKQDVAGLVHPF
jgi:hypothetical protein